MSSEQSPVVEQIVEAPTCGMNTAVESSSPCAVAAPCAIPVQDCSPCAMPVQDCSPCAMPVQDYMPCNDYNQCGDFNQQHVGFRQSIRNMFRRHSESSCSTTSGNDWNQCQPCQPMACEPCQPVCEPCPPKPVMKKGYRTEKYCVQVPYDKKIKVACQVPSFEKKTICRQVQCEKTKYVPVKVPYTKNVKETIKVPTTKTVYKTQIQKCFKTETKCRKVPYWYCEQPKPVCPPQPCNPCEMPMSCDPCGDDFGMRKRDRFMNSIRRPFEAIDDKWDQFEDRVESKWDSRFNNRNRSCEYEDVYDCNRKSSCGGKKSFWRSFFG